MAVTQTLSVTEVSGSVNNSANTSKVRILWQSTQTGDSHNDYTRVAKYYVSINGGAEKEYSVSYTLPKGTTKTIVDTTITVAHNANGTGTVKVRTYMETGISAGVVEKTQTINLTTIPRASTISYVSNVTLGNICTVRWTPRAKEFRFKIKFAVGNWSLTTAVIHPNVTSLYTNASYGISIDAAHQFPNSKDADMTVTLYTYSDEGGTKQIGEASTATCKVYIPENENTLPTVKMNLSPVSSLGDNFSGLYIQNKTRVKASFTGSNAKYSANLTSYSMNVDGKTYGDPYQSDLLSKFGTIPVNGIVKDSRGFSASIAPDINVIAYSKPNLIPTKGETSVVCKRCDSMGDLSPSGTYLRIKAGRKYSKVMVDGVQKNHCTLRYRHKAESAENYSSWIDLPSNVRNPANLISLPYRQNSQTSNGLTWTVQRDGSVRVVGTSTAYTEFVLNNIANVSLGGRYTIRTNTTDTNVSLGVRYSYIENGVTKWGQIGSWGSGSGTIPTNVTPQNIYFQVNAGRTVDTILYPTVNEGTTAEPYFLGDETDAILEGIVPSISTSYKVQVGAFDDIGESSILEFSIPTAQVTVHLRKGGKGIGIGKYSEKDNCVEIEQDWELNAKGTLRAGHIASIDDYASKNFNELIYATGYYTGTAAPSTTSCSNYPVDKTGLLEVISSIKQNSETSAWWGFAYQTYRTHDGEVYMRSYYSASGWTAWKKISLT